MKRFIILSLVVLSFLSVNAQDVKDTETKMTEFASKTGVIIKFEDYNLDNIKIKYGAAEAKIRKVISGGDTGLFYQISYETKYGTKTASIAYEDLLETQKALESLKAQASADSGTESDYVENKFVTDDGFQIGYFISDGKLNWYMMLEKYGSGNTVFINKVSEIEEAFSDAMAKIKELKQQ